jgi:hypothetical protein
MKSDPKFVAQSAQRLFCFFSEGVDVLVKENGVSVAFLSELSKLFQGISLSKDKRTAKMLNIFSERLEAFTEELLSLGPGP